VCGVRKRGTLAQALLMYGRDGVLLEWIVKHSLKRLIISDIVNLE
jgi:hypothetical protein